MTTGPQPDHLPVIVEGAPARLARRYGSVRRVCRELEAILGRLA